MKRAHWGSRVGFILAAAGSAIGLGNLWKFPYITGVNGGGLFVLIYLGCIFAVGVPILIAEMAIGQKSQSNAIKAFEVLDKPGSPWQGIGLLGLLTAILILSFYSVVGGWILNFTVFSFTGAFDNLTTENAGSLLAGVFSSPLSQSVYHFVFLTLTVGIVLSGVKGGLEKWNKILMPSLLIILVFLFLYSFSLKGSAKALSFLFSADTSKLTASGVLEAVGHSFFTLSLGMGTMITYGSYLSKKENLIKTSLMIAFLDTAIALIAGVVIFSVVFSFGMEAQAGPGLIFATLPTLFHQIPGGTFIGILFFLLISFAAITSAVSMLEVMVAFISEKFKISRFKATSLAGSATFFLGLLTVISTNIAKNSFQILGTTNFFDLFDKLTSSYFLPIGGIMISLFFGWKMSETIKDKILKSYPQWMVQLFLVSVRFIAPIAVLIVIYNESFL